MGMYVDGNLLVSLVGEADPMSNDNTPKIVAASGIG